MVDQIRGRSTDQRYGAEGSAQQSSVAVASPDDLLKMQATIESDQSSQVQDIPAQVILRHSDRNDLGANTTGTVDLTAAAHSAREELAHQEALAEVARQALSDLVGSPSRRRGGDPMDTGMDSMEWLR